MNMNVEMYMIYNIYICIYTDTHFPINAPTNNHCAHKLIDTRRDNTVLGTTKFMMVDRHQIACRA